MTLRKASVALALASFASLLATACEKKPQPTGMVPDAASVPIAVPEEGAVDIAQCQPCTLTPAQQWKFEGIYRDSTCTDPVAQLVAAACSIVPAVGQVSLTYVDEVGLRKANETATVTLVEQIQPESIRYRTAGKECMKANEAATPVTPMACNKQRICRDPGGFLVCQGCRTFANGCPDFLETRMYASINDPGLKAKPGAGGGGRLAACCAAIAAEARRLGPSPEAGVLMTAAAQCNALVAQAGPNATAPELGAVRTLLAGRNIAACNGL